MNSTRRAFLQGSLALGTLTCFHIDSQASIWRRNSVLVLNADSEKILYSSQAAKLCYPASTTKLMTLLLLFDELDSGRLTWDTKIRFSENAARTMASKLWVQEGYEMSVRSAVSALIVKSANDVAVAVAEHMNGSEAAFAERMTAKARNLGMENTVFKNPHGLPNTSHVTTATDMSKLALTLIRSEHYPLFRTKTWGQHRNTNRLLFSYPGCDGLKTGYIRASGSNLVASAKRNGKRALVVYFGGKTSSHRNQQVASYLNQAFRQMS